MNENDYQIKLGVTCFLLGKTYAIVSTLLDKLERDESIPHDIQIQLYTLIQDIERGCEKYIYNSDTTNECS